MQSLPLQDSPHTATTPTPNFAVVLAILCSVTQGERLAYGYFANTSFATQMALIAPMLRQSIAACTACAKRSRACTFCKRSNRVIRMNR